MLPVERNDTQKVVKVADDDVGPVLLDPSLPAAICGAIGAESCTALLRLGKRWVGHVGRHHCW